MAVGLLVEATSEVLYETRVRVTSLCVWCVHRVRVTSLCVWCVHKQTINHRTHTRQSFQHTHTHTDIHVYMYMYAHTHTHTHTQKHTCIHVRIHTHAHTETCLFCMRKYYSVHTIAHIYIIGNVVTGHVL